MKKGIYSRTGGITLLLLLVHSWRRLPPYSRRESKERRADRFACCAFWWIRFQSRTKSTGVQGGDQESVFNLTVSFNSSFEVQGHGVACTGAAKNSFRLKSTPGWPPGTPGRQRYQGLQKQFLLAAETTPRFSFWSPACSVKVAVLLRIMQARWQIPPL